MNYSVSPYAYCQNNPVNRTDPDGQLDDWWVDNTNGGLIHTNGDNKPKDFDNGNVSYLGEDGMFGKDGEKIEAEDNKTENGETYVGNETAKEMAENNGMERVPQKVLSETTVQTISSITPSTKVSVKNVSVVEVHGDYTYVKKESYSEAKSHNVLHDQSNTNGYTQVSIEQRSYYQPSVFSKVLNYITGLVTPTGYKSPTIYNGFDNYPKNGKLNRYKNQLN
jgi:hypothetical protein